MSLQPEAQESEMLRELAADVEERSLTWREVALGVVEWIYDHAVLVLTVDDGLLPPGQYALIEAFGEDT